MQEFRHIIAKEEEIEKQKAAIVIEEFDESGVFAKVTTESNKTMNSVKKEETINIELRDTSKRYKEPLLFKTPPTDNRVHVKLGEVQWQSSTKHKSSAGNYILLI